MKRFLVALTLLCALSRTTLAGDMETCGYAPPTPPPTVETADTAVLGDIPSSDSLTPGDVHLRSIDRRLTVLDLVS